MIPCSRAESTCPGPRVPTAPGVTSAQRSGAACAGSAALASPHRRPKIRADNGRVRSADFGVLAAVQLHDVGVGAAFWLCDAGIPAAVQLPDTEAAPGDQLAQVPHPAHACDRDSYGGGEDGAAEQREPADDVSQ